MSQFHVLDLVVAKEIISDRDQGIKTLWVSGRSNYWIFILYLDDIRSEEDRPRGSFNSVYFVCNRNL